MPAAAVIPAPIAYLNVVAVKKLVVEFLSGMVKPTSLTNLGHPLVSRIRSSIVGSRSKHFTLKKSECFRQAFA